MNKDRLPHFDDAAIVIEVAETAGSTPREKGAFMVVTHASAWGTIGGGHMEFSAVDLARRMLAEGIDTASLEVVLGPESGQCCGGRVKLALMRLGDHTRTRLERRFLREAEAYPDVFIFGAGHVGRALYRSLEPLPLCVTVIESRQQEFGQLPEGANARLVAIPEGEIASIRAGGAVVILTHDHALDFLIGAEALVRDDLAYVGMIGSHTKRGVFSSWLEKNGQQRCRLDRLVLPIGGTQVRDKRPEVIAALVAAELITHLLGNNRIER